MQIANRCVICDSTEFNTLPAQLAPFISYRIFPWRPVYTIGDVFDLVAKKKVYRLFRPLLYLLGLGTKYFPLMIAAIHCRKCGFLFSDLRPDSAELARIYSDYRGPSYVRDRKRFEPGYAQFNFKLGDAEEVALRVANLEEVLKKVKLPLDEIHVLLDYGGDEGQFIPDSMHGTRKIVYEVSDKPARAGVEKIAEIAKVPPIDFGMICHVLEHIPYPLDTLLELRSLIRPGGYVYIEVPLDVCAAIFGLTSIDGLERGDIGTGSVFFHEHINFFSPRSVGRLLQRAGFEVVFNEIAVLELRGVPTKIISAIGKRIG